MNRAGLPYRLPPSLDDIEALAREAFDSMPPPLRSAVAALVLMVEDFPDPATERDMALDSGFDLLGLYRGHPLPYRIADTDTDAIPDRVFLYRRPILDYWCETGEDLAAIVRHVLIHEIGHHFGFLDEDMDRLENEVAQG